MGGGSSKQKGAAQPALEGVGITEGQDPAEVVDAVLEDGAQ